MGKQKFGRNPYPSNRYSHNPPRRGKTFKTTPMRDYVSDNVNGVKVRHPTAVKDITPPGTKPGRMLAHNTRPTYIRDKDGTMRRATNTESVSRSWRNKEIRRRLNVDVLGYPKKRQELMKAWALKHRVPLSSSKKGNTN